MNNINGGGRRGNVVSSMDFYRRVPRDLTEATTLGAFMSAMACTVMLVLFVSETWAFLSTSLSTAITVDDNTETQIRLNFNVTMHDLACDYVSVDVWDALGTNRQNVTKNVDKWQLDDTGARRIFAGRNRDLREVRHDELTFDQVRQVMEKDETMVTDLTLENFEEFTKNHDMAFVDMYAPWCVWCQRLAPIWEKLAESIREKQMPVGIGKIDCMAQADLCREQRVMAFPTLRWYHDGKPMAPDYKMDRTVDALLAFAQRKLDMDEKYKEWEKTATTTDDTEKERKRLLYQQHRPEHPGCQVSGHLMVNRVPGNFHIEAKSINHNLNAAMTNLSHTVNHLSFGSPLDKASRRTKRILKQVSDEHKQFSPLDEHSYVTAQFHAAFHHYIKVVSTHLRMGSSLTNQLITYQFLEQSQTVLYEEEAVPEARFSYDLSPMSVVVQKEGRKWYDYLTSLCAIMGGTFTTLGLIDAFLYTILKPKKL